MDSESIVEIKLSEARQEELLRLILSHLSLDLPIFHSNLPTTLHGSLARGEHFAWVRISNRNSSPRHIDFPILDACLPYTSLHALR